MKKLFVLLLIAAAGYYLYTHQELWKKYAHQEMWSKYNPFASKTEPQPDNTGLKQTVAWKMITRRGYGAYNTEVLLIDGNRWRIEAKEHGSPKIAVAVSDGARTAASPPTASIGALDPRPTVNQLIASAARVSDAAQGKSPDATEQRDGHTCWKSTVNFRGMAVEFWVDSSTGFPVCIDGTINGTHGDVHISPLQGDFTQDGGDYFNADHTEALFAKDLDDDANDAQIALFSHGPGQADPVQASSIPAPATSSQYRYVLKEPVSVKNSYGTMILPAKTEVRVLSQAGDVYHVAGGGAEFDVQGEQILSVPQ